MFEKKVTQIKHKISILKKNVFPGGVGIGNLILCIVWLPLVDTGNCGAHMCCKYSIYTFLYSRHEFLYNIFQMQ